MPARPTILERKIQWVKYSLRMGDVNFQKRGLQLLCRLVEGGAQIPLHRVSEEMTLLKGSPNVKVRLWHYKCIAAMKARPFLEYIVFQLYFGEIDHENLTWAGAALCAIAPTGVLEKWAEERKVEVTGSFGLASRLYSDHPLGDGISSTLPSRFETDPLLAKWFCMLFGYDRTTEVGDTNWKPLDLIRDLNSHPDFEVMEFSVWALWRASATGPKDLAIEVDFDSKKPPNVRRWLYQLRAKGASVKQLDQIVHLGIDETDMLAREGAAIGISTGYCRQLVIPLVDWFYSESALIVKVALVRHFTRFRSRSSPYRDILMELYRQAKQGDASAVAMLRAAASESHLLIDDLSLLANDDSMVQPLLQFTGPVTGPVNIVQNHSGTGAISVGSIAQDTQPSIQQ